MKIIGKCTGLIVTECNSQCYFFLRKGHFYPFEEKGRELYPQDFSRSCAPNDKLEVERVIKNC